MYSRSNDNTSREELAKFSYELFNGKMIDEVEFKQSLTTGTIKLQNTGISTDALI